MSTCLDCFGVNTIEPCAEVGCLTTNFGKCVTYSGEGLFCSAGPINTFTFTGTAVAAVSDTTVVVSASGGTGTGATFSVTRGPASTNYTVSIVNKGGGYVVGDILTIAGTALGGASTANDITISVTTLSALIDSTYSLDAAIKNLHDRICNLTPSGLLYSGFNFSCLRVGGNLESVGNSISTAQEFAESASAALCAVNSRLKSVETPTFTVPSCTTGLTSNSSTLGAILTEYGNVLCGLSAGTGVAVTGVTVPGSCSMTTMPASSASLGTWFDWVVDNMCSITTSISSSLTTTNTNVSTISTFLGSTTRFNNSANCLTSLGGTSTDTAHATIGYLTTKLCTVDGVVTAIPAYIKNDSIGLNWVGAYGSAPYSYSNTATTIQTQLQRIVNVLNLEKTSFTSDFTVTTNPNGSRTVALASSSSFACSALASCSINGLGDVSITTPSDPHVLYYNGTNWVNKNINQLVTFSSSDSSITVTPTTTAGNVNIDIKVGASTAPVRAEFTPLSISGANNTSSAAFPGIPGSGYLYGVKESNQVLLVGSVRLVSTSGFTLTSGTPVPIASAPAALHPPHTVYLPVTILRRTTSPYLEPSGTFTGVVVLDTAGTLSLIPYPVFPAGSLAITELGANVEIIFGGMSYSMLP